MEMLIISELLKNRTPKGLLSDKQYIFRFSRSTADILTIIIKKAYQSLHKNG